MDKLVYIVNGNAQYRSLFQSLGFKVAQDLGKHVDLVCFTGGADVTPAMYGDNKHPYTGNDIARDQFEVRMFDKAKDLAIPMVGICRGGQFLNVMSGGRMYQHVTKHGIHGTHDMIDVETGEHIPVTSTHHQMFMPSEQAVIVAIATLGGEREWYDGEVFKRDVSNTDYEVVYYEATNSLCFQPHPEFNGEGLEAMKDYFARCLNKYLGV
jgi:carbamoylphosphate synthase small subunit